MQHPARQYKQMKDGVVSIPFLFTEVVNIAVNVEVTDYLRPVTLLALLALELVHV